ncbi:MAG TPA: AsmA-like C-terminal region-containing protein [Gemmataceae bacterium]|nr:AsmA-like C-terminal region-containing protein [Gemmataceae bacterium]
MKRAAWLRKALWITPVVLLVLAVAGLFILRSYLSSAAAAQQVAEHLQDMLGGRVEVQSANIGLIGNSSVRGIQVYADGEADKPWLRIDDVTSDLSVLSLLRDKSPDVIRLQGAHVTLRFDTDGHLLTKLPSGKKGAPTKLPRLHIKGSQLTIDQQHRRPMIIRGLNADIAPGDNNRMTLTGAAHDPFWGDWQAHGDFDTAAGKSSIILDSKQIAVTMEKLKSIAFVPLSVWDEVHVEGNTPATIQLDMDTGGDKPSVSYRVEIAPRDGRVEVPSIELAATQANGKAVIADEIIQLDNVHGKTAGGSITTSGKLNFRDEPTRLAFKVGVQDVHLHELPRSWEVPPSVDGKLTGSADLVLTLKNGKVETAGSGEGIIRDAKWSGIPIDKPVRLALRSEDGRFRFHKPEPMTQGEEKPDQGERETRVPEPAPPAPQGPANEQALLTARKADAPKEKPQPGDGDFFHNAPSEMVNLLGHGIKMTADGLAHGINAVADALGKLKPPSKPNEEPTYLDVDLSLKDVDLAQLVKKLGLNLPYPVTGRLTFQVHASIPVNTAGDLKAYRLRGSAKLPSFTIDGLAMANVEAQVRYANGVLDLQNLHGQMPEPGVAKTTGKFSGDARVQVAPRGDVQASLKLDQMPLSTLLSLVPDVGGQVKGAVTGTVRARAPLEKLSDPATWRGAANLSAPAMEVYGIPLRDAAVGVIVDETRARLTTFKTNVEGAPLTGKGEIQLKGDYPFKAEVGLASGDLASLNRLAPAFRPPFTLKGRTRLEGSVSGTLKPLHYDTKGELYATNLVVERFTVDDVSFHWLKDKNDLKLDKIKMDLYGGSVSGTARLPLSSEAPGSADLAISNLNVQAMAKALPAFPVRLEGTVSGKVKGELSAAAGDKPRTWASSLVVTAPQLRVQGIPAEKLKGSISSRDGKTSYNLQGETLGGTFSLKGDLPVPAKEEEKNPPAKPVGQGGPELLPVRAVEVAAQQPAADTVGRGHLELRGARLARLWDAYRISGELAQLDGRFSIVLDYRHTEPDFFPIGKGTFRIEDISWGDMPLADNLQGDVRLTTTLFQLNNITGEVAGGMFFGRIDFGVKTNARGSFRIELQQVDASRLLLPLPAVAAHVKGPVDMMLRGRIGREWSGSGGITLARGQIYGMSITEWRLPLTFSFSPSQGTGELSIRDSHARIAQGRAQLQSTLHWGNGLRLTGLLLFYQVDLRTLFQHSPSISAYISGRVSGRVDLAGSEMRSLNDLTAVVQARMEQGQALQMPVLRQITPYLRPGASKSRFQSGDLKGRLAGGIFRIEHAGLVGDFLKLLILGTVNLAGNLNLDVTAQTGLYCLNPTQTNALRSRIPIIGAIPRLLLYEASSLLSAAVVHLRVTGTVHSPVVRLEPLLVMTEEAIRFFLGRAVGLAMPNSP